MLLFFPYTAVAGRDLQLKGGGGGGGAFEDFTMTVEFCEDNSGSSEKITFFRINKAGWQVLWIRLCTVTITLNEFNKKLDACQ